MALPWQLKGASFPAIIRDIEAFVAVAGSFASRQPLINPLEIIVRADNLTLTAYAAPSFCATMESINGLANIMVLAYDIVNCAPECIYTRANRLTATASALFVSAWGSIASVTRSRLTAA